MNRLNNQRGFYLIELIVSIAILAILVAAFMPLLSSSYANIFRAGNQSKASFQAQQEMEEALTQKTSGTEQQLQLVFPGNVIVNVEGSLLQVTTPVNNTDSSLVAFMPTAATMTISPKNLPDNYSNPTFIQVVGENTNFTASTTVMIQNNSGATIPAVVTLEVTDSTNAKLAVKSGLDYRNGPYTLVLKTGSQVVKAVLKVNPPHSG